MQIRPLQLQIRAVLVSFEAAARTHAQRDDDSALRWAYDRAQQLLDSLRPATPDERRELLLAHEAALQAYRHHLEGACGTGEPQTPVEQR